MGWGKAKVPNTISDKDMADLQRRAQKKAQPKDLFDPKAVKQRLNSNAQRGKASSS